MPNSEENFLEGLAAMTADSENADDNMTDVDSANMPDFDDPILSDSDMQRLANMDLDNIIEDVTSDSISVEDLFGTGEIQEVKEFKVADKPSDNFTDNNVSADDTNNEDEISDDSKKGKKVKKKKAKKEKAEKKSKSKKGAFGVLKNVFFESIEETKPMMSEEEVKKANADNRPDNNQKLVDDIADKDAEQLDENEKLINEMYGADAEKEENVAPKKGLFAKMKYRLEQIKKKNEAEDIAEQEAEEREYEKNREIRENKKAAKKEKQEAAKVAKAEAAEEAKKLKEEKKKQAEANKKPKKEKKPKPAPKPGDILKIKPKSVFLFIMFVSGVVVLIVVLSSSIRYNQYVGAAKASIESGDYSKAYEVLSGMDLKDNDKAIYDQASLIMYVEVHYESYQNYMKLNMRTEAINSLVKGLDRFDEYYESARELSAGQYMTDVKEDILTAFKDTFKISEAEAESLVRLSHENFTEYYTKIEAYGKAL